MEALSRKPFQGIKNIIRFNWHFYVLAIFVILLLYIGGRNLPAPLHLYCTAIGLLIAAGTSTSLLVSFYVYDLSNLYKLDWLDLAVPVKAVVVNINAGFDETSSLLAKKYPTASLTVLNFYDPQKHTEVSIKRARKVYAIYPGTKSINSTNTGFAPNSIDYIFCFLSAHEIRNGAERIAFFKQLKSGLTPTGKIIVVEHLRNFANFIAYNIGFFHFHSKNEWMRTFTLSGLTVTDQQKITPFITAFILSNNGTAS